MRFYRLLVCSLMATALGCASDNPSESDTMCNALTVFAESIDDTDVYEVTLRTEWNAEPTIACGPRTPAPEGAFCNYLVENSSIEFMTTNIERVLECVGKELPPGSEPPYLGGLSGTVISYDPAFTDLPIVVVVGFDTRSDRELPSLGISMSRRATP